MSVNNQMEKSQSQGGMPALFCTEAVFLFFYCYLVRESQLLFSSCVKRKRLKHPAHISQFKVGIIVQSLRE